MTDLNQAIVDYNKITKKMAELNVTREDLIQQIISGLHHKHEGQKSYTVGKWKVEVKTPPIYSLDKKRYIELQGKLPPEYNPVRESISYTIDKKVCDEAMDSAPAHVTDLLIELITKKAGKPNITIKDRV